MTAVFHNIFLIILAASLCSVAALMVLTPTDAQRVLSRRVNTIQLATLFLATSISPFIQLGILIIPALAETSLLAIAASTCAFVSGNFWFHAVRGVAAESDRGEVFSKEEHHEILRQLDGTQRRLSELASVSADWLWRMDKRGSFEYFSDGFFNCLSIDPGSALGRPLKDIVKPRNIETGWPVFDACLREQKPFRDLVLDCGTREGMHYSLRLSGRPKYNTRDEFVGFQGIGTDMTQQKLLHEATTTSNAKDGFLASMSHEMRTPLNGILGILELLAETDLNEDQAKLIDTASTSGKTLLQLINEVLDFSRIRAGHIELSPAPSRLAASLAKAVNTLRPLAEKSENKLTISHDGLEDIVLQVDERRVCQVAVNLVGNAIKFTDRGHIDVTFTSKPTESGMEMFRGEVRDTGVGIAEEKQKLVFWKFETVREDTDFDVVGTGLGLALCRELLEAMGGRIGVESTPGQGSLFWFELELPRIMHAAFEDSSSLQHDPSKSVLDKQNILLVEDNPTNAMVATRFLEAAGHTVTHAVDGWKAISSWQSNSFDIVLMDVSMPRLNGIDATKRIRKLEETNRRPRTIIIGLTAHASPRERERILMCGMDACLSKPLGKSDLLGALASFAATSPDGAAAVMHVDEPLELGTEKLPGKTQIQASATKPTSGKTKKNHNSPKILDLGSFHSLIDDAGADAITDLIEVLRNELGMRRAQLLKSRAQSDLALCQSTCHAIAGSAATIGAARLAEICRRVENACHEKGDIKYLSLVPVIVTEIELAMKLIDNAVCDLTVCAETENL